MSQTKVIQTIEEIEGAKGTYLKVTWTDGKTSNVFKEEHRKVVRQAESEGKAVTYNVKKEGQFWNITSMCLAELPLAQPKPSASSAPPAPAIPKAQQYDSGQSTNERIAEQVAFKGVIDLLCAKVINLDHLWAKGAERFLNDHLVRGSEPLSDAPESVRKLLKTESSPKGRIILDKDWLKESLTTLQWADVLKFIKDNYKIQASRVTEALEKMTEEQQADFQREVQDRLVGL